MAARRTRVWLVVSNTGASCGRSYRATATAATLLLLGRRRESWRNASWRACRRRRRRCLEFIHSGAGGNAHTHTQSGNGHHDNDNENDNNGAGNLSCHMRLATWLPPNQYRQPAAGSRWWRWCWRLQRASGRQSWSERAGCAVKTAHSHSQSLLLLLFRADRAN